jgi:hypothetical protein
MSRTRIAITAGVAAVATAAVIATAGSAQGPGPTSLHLVSKSSMATTNPSELAASSFDVLSIENVEALLPGENGVQQAVDFMSTEVGVAFA